MEAIITHITPSRDAAIRRRYMFVKIRDDGIEKEELFCEEHGQQYSRARAPGEFPTTADRAGSKRKPSRLGNGREKELGLESTLGDQNIIEPYGESSITFRNHISQTRLI